MSKVYLSYLLLSYLAVLVKSNDLRLGYASPQSTNIYSEIKEADPALWKRTDDIIVNTPNNEVISAIFVTDLREDKDGESFIESGGIGAKSVTIGLKSPSILRGYRFEIEVYANDPNARFYSKGGNYFDNSQYPRKY
ncbi:uncharacterized protein ACR2FA_007567 [Aphomia sociella]